MGVSSPQPIRRMGRLSAWARTQIEVIEAALEPFDGAIEDLLASLPRGVSG